MPKFNTSSIRECLHPYKRGIEMYNEEKIKPLLEYLKSVDIYGYAELSKIIIEKFNLQDDNHTYYNEYYAIRFSDIEVSKSNCVVGLKKIIGYNDRPFINIQISNTCVHACLINLTFIDNATHTSAKELRMNNWIGTILIRDIIMNIEIKGRTLSNEIENFKELFQYHEYQNDTDNMARIVGNRIRLNREIEEKNKKNPVRFEPDESQVKNIDKSVQRALNYWKCSKRYEKIKKELDDKVESVKEYILKAAEINHVKKRGNIIEYLITSDPTDTVLIEIKKALNSQERMPRIKTKNELGDYHCNEEGYKIEIDIKSHLQTSRGSAPKGYNVDKVLEFLSKDNTIFLLYFLAINKDKGTVKSLLVPMYHELLHSTKLIGHHVGVGRRGEVQFQKKQIEELYLLDKIEIDEEKANDFLQNVLFPENMKNEA